MTSLPNKSNFEQNMYERGIKLNSGHGTTSLGSVTLNATNPINNEV